jgi:PBP1b-binding outer membrane lipoprotein LpoB
MAFPNYTMKKYICILAGAALLAACEQKTETTEPAASPTATPATTTESPAVTTESPAAGTYESPAESPTP